MMGKILKFILDYSWHCGMYLVRYLTLVLAGISWYCTVVRYLSFLCMALFSKLILFL